MNICSPVTKLPLEKFGLPHCPSGTPAQFVPCLSAVNVLSTDQTHVIAYCTERLTKRFFSFSSQFQLELKPETSHSQDFNRCISIWHLSRSYIRKLYHKNLTNLNFFIYFNLPNRNIAGPKNHL